MQSLSTCLVAAALFVVAVNAQFQINTPSVFPAIPYHPPTSSNPPPVQALPSVSPLSLPGLVVKHPTSCINPGGVPGAAALQQYSGLTGTSFSWSTNISAGTSIGLQLTDSTGQIAQSAPVTIQSGPSSSCLNGEQTSSTSSGASTSAASTTGNSGTSTTAPAASTTGTTKASTSGSSAGSASGSKTSASASSSSTAAAGGNGALSNVASAGVVGVVGALAAALLA